MRKTLIIAEAGVNHNGDIRLAKRMVDEAKKAGADCVKFQTYNVNSMVSKYVSMADYQKKNTGSEETQKSMLEKLSLSKEEFLEIYRYCNEKEIVFLSSPFDIDSIRFLNDLQKAWKIPSGEITNYPYLVEIAKTGKEIILSTGMSTLDEVSIALDVLTENGSRKVTLLHCTTNYPAPYEDVNLNAMLTMRNRFGCEVGYSDHTKWIDIPVAAVALGATIIEKHFTLDRNMEGPDHKASLEPDEFADMVRGIRNVETAMGTGKKNPVPSEIGNIDFVRKSIVAAKEIKEGEILTEENITTKRPGSGISPMKWKDILGTKAVRDFQEDELIVI